MLVLGLWTQHPFQDSKNFKKILQYYSKIQLGSIENLWITSCRSCRCCLVVFESSNRTAKEWGTRPGESQTHSQSHDPSCTLRTSLRAILKAFFEAYYAYCCPYNLHLEWIILQTAVGTLVELINPKFFKSPMQLIIYFLVHGFQQHNLLITCNIEREKILNRQG